MTYGQVLIQINNSVTMAWDDHCITSIPTLGGRSSFSVCNNHGNILVVSRKRKAMTVTREFYDAVWQRDRDLQNRN